MKSVLITGGAGFLGSHLCDLMLTRGLRVICLDNLITGSMDNISHHAGNDRFKFTKHDVTQHIHLPDEVDHVLHFASPASPVDYLQHPIHTLKVGALGTHNALGLAKSQGAGFLLASTSEVYGDPLVHPQKEEYYGNVNPIGSRGVYDEAKRFAEAITMAYHNVHGLDTKIARIFNTYGPRMRRNDGRAIPAFVDSALKGEPLVCYGDGSQTRSFCYVSDLVEGIFLLLHSDIHTPVNIGNPTEMTILELGKAIRDMTKSSSEIVFRPAPTEDDPKVRRPDISLAREALGWEPKVGLREGLEKTIEWFSNTQEQHK
ncbi:MAG: NAD-dependent epimerase/dehydratase family protein [Armatimonadetes bacterium]|nr:NAD-dependent epimerase/dehydratase family protein [Armatimonadota bacterium]NIM23941.1 NAD-dependent epimerase/dehydratase family protein [Armatimonadota bacterium]NIM67788.1 NAD-dependent epimerase/dehydratase family protein [Armatimonadota bacterium]NIM76328.1 NAD-dependent epimerase/dehydratase family protein [Armatimonadota bacterium]NIN06022.1 NAD-dependent epimerase/dehydratase family protein [Armatimonadota bacterium]